MAPTSGNFCTLVLGLDICTCCEFGAICVRQSADLFDFEITLLWADQMFPSSSFLSIDFSAASIVSRCLICLTSISSFLWFDFHKGFLCCLYCVFVWFWVHLLLPLIWFLCCCLYCVLLFDLLFDLISTKDFSVASIVSHCSQCDLPAPGDSSCW